MWKWSKLMPAMRQIRFAIGVNGSREQGVGRGEFLGVGWEMGGAGGTANAVVCVQFVDVMAIYGTALLAFCHLLGMFVGDVLGVIFGVGSNVGGVGISMLALMGLRWFLGGRGWLGEERELGVRYWGVMYIPVVVAMAMQQDVVRALGSGVVAVTAAGLSVLACMGCVALMNRLGEGGRGDDV